MTNPEKQFTQELKTLDLPPEVGDYIKDLERQLEDMQPVRKELSLKDLTKLTSAELDEFTELNNEATRIMSLIRRSRNEKRIVKNIDEKEKITWERIDNLEPIYSKEFEDKIESLSFSPDGKKIVVQDGHDVLRIIDRENGKEILTKDFKYNIARPSFSPDGQEIMVDKILNELQIIDMKGEITFSKDFKHQIGLPSFSPDGKEIMFTIEQGVRIIDREGNNIFSKKIGDNLWYSFFSPDGKEIIIRTRDEKLLTLNREGKEITNKTFKTKIGHRVFDPNGDIITSREETFLDRRGPTILEIINKDGRKIFSKDLKKSINLPIFSPDKKEILLVHGYKTMEIYKIIGKRKE